VKTKFLQPRLSRVLIGILAGSLGLFVVPTTQAQYSANFQTNLISGVVSNWAGDYVVGSNTFADVLLIRNGGELFDRGGYVGSFSIGSNNSVLVADAGSAWQNTNGPLLVTGKGNSLGSATRASVEHLGRRVAVPTTALSSPGTVQPGAPRPRRYPSSSVAWADPATAWPSLVAAE
jgi:hypothetical protein